MPNDNLSIGGGFDYIMQLNEENCCYNQEELNAFKMKVFELHHEAQMFLPCKSEISCCDG